MNNNSQEITNPKKQVPTGLALNDKDYAGSLLSCCKNMEKNLTVALTEASNETLYNELHSMFCDIAKLQREVYEMMFRDGWYPMEKVENQKIQKKEQTLSQEFQDLN